MNDKEIRCEKCGTVLITPTGLCESCRKAKIKEEQQKNADDGYQNSAVGGG